MKISGIDEDLENIINYLDRSGYKPFASCDGVLAHHEHPEDVEDAYISFLESHKIVELMASFLKDGRFTITFENSNSITPYNLYGNEIAGNVYSTNFYNQNGEMTSVLNSIVMQATKDKGLDVDDEVIQLKRLSDTLKQNDHNSELKYSVSFASRMEPNRLSISTKMGCKPKDMDQLIDRLQNQFQDEEITIDNFTKSDSRFEITFSDEQFEQILGLISYCKSIEYSLPILERNDELFRLFGKTYREESLGDFQDDKTVPFYTNKIGKEETQALAETRTKGALSRISNWFKNLFRGRNKEQENAKDER